MKEESLIGEKFNRLTVVSEKYKKEHKYTYYVDVVCDCGTTFSLRHGKLRGERPTRSCGCLQRESASRLKSVVPIGSVFGRLTILEDLGVEGRRRKVLASCACGSGCKEYRWERLEAGNTASCGCLQPERMTEINTKHGLTRSPTYSSWQSMKDRTLNPKCREYPIYGGSGITIDPRWREFQNFLDDMGERPTWARVIDRVDNSQGYFKWNCRWADSSVSNHNKAKRLSSQAHSKFIGVCQSDKKSVPYQARLSRGGVYILNKRFRTEIEAAEAYDEASFSVYGDRPNKKLIEEYYKEGKINSG